LLLYPVKVVQPAGTAPAAPKLPTPEAMELSLKRAMRELENEIERLVVLAGDEKVIGEELLSARIRQAPEKDEASAPGVASLPAAVDLLERNMILEVLKRNHWNKTRAAAELRISRRNLIRKVEKYKLEQRRAR